MVIEHDDCMASSSKQLHSHMATYMVHRSKALTALIGSAAKPPRILPSTAPQTFDSSPVPSQNTRKRKRIDLEDDEHPRRAKHVGGFLSDEDQSMEKKAEVRMSCIRPPSFVFPKTAYNGHIPSLPRHSEKSVLQDVLVS